MTTMVRCLEGHPFDMDAMPTCPQCGSTVWRDAVKEAAEKAAMEAKRAREVKEAREAAEKAERSASAARAMEDAAKVRGAASATESPGGDDVVARAARAARDAREAAAARAAAQVLEERERIALAQKAERDEAEKEKRKATDVERLAGGEDDEDAAARARAAREARDAEGAGKLSDVGSASAGLAGAATNAKAATTRGEFIAGFLALVVGGPLLLFVAYTLILRASHVYEEIGERQPDNTGIESLSYLAALESRHNFMAGRDDVEYGPHVGRGLARRGVTPLGAVDDRTATPSPIPTPRSLPDPMRSLSKSASDPTARTTPNPFDEQWRRFQWAPPSPGRTGDAK